MMKNLGCFNDCEARRDIFIAITLDESTFLDVLHFSMKNIKPRDPKGTPIGGTTSEQSSDVVYSCWCGVGRVLP